MRLQLCIMGVLAAIRVFSAEPMPMHEWILLNQADGSGRWLSAKGGLTGVTKGELIPKAGWVELDGKGSIVVADVKPDSLPKQSISVEALVRVDEPLRWGGIIMFAQDNGSYEKGWNLGYINDRFAFQISVGPKLVTILSKSSIEKGSWFHVAGTYDGRIMRLYINGVEEASSSAAIGPIAYPPSAFYSIGAYHDKDEYFPMKGAIRDVRLYDLVLSPGQVAKRSEVERACTPQPLGFAVKPSLAFDSSETATIEWQPLLKGKTSLHYGTTEGMTLKSDVVMELNSHKVHLEKLLPSTLYYYRIEQVKNKITDHSKTYTFDTSFNYLLPVLPAAESAGDNIVNTTAQKLLEYCGTPNGVCVVYGLTDGRLTRALALNSSMNILALDTDQQRIKALRNMFYREKLYGSRITIAHIKSWQALLIPASLANMITTERPPVVDPSAPDAKTALRLLAPNGTIVIPSVSRKTLNAATEWLEICSKPLIERAGKKLAVVSIKKPWPASFGSWTHQYGDLGNTATSMEELNGATSTEELQVQWIGRPGADFGLDRNPRMPAPLAVSGRLFHQGMNRIIALDAFNGTVLWHQEIPNLRRVNIPRDASNWCADSEQLYVIVEDQAWIIEQTTGKKSGILTLPSKDKTAHEWGYIGNNQKLIFGSTVKKGSTYTAFWSGAMWYDKGNAVSTAKVCSDSLFAKSKQGDNPTVWNYRNGTIINTTICGTENRIYFVESRHPEPAQLASGRISAATLWEQQFLVALDSSSGRKLWEQPLDTESGDIVFFMQCRGNHIIIIASTAAQYFLYDFDARSGQQRWIASHKWTANNHSGHMQHPVLFDDAVYVEPFGYNIENGERLAKRMAGREGCHIYIGAADALIYRGKARETSMWNRKTGKVSSWSNLRPSCWLSVIPANGMLLTPEGGGGCSCGRWIETSMVFVPVPGEKR